MPDEPFFLDAVDVSPQYPKRMPRSVRYWCYLALATNVIALAIAIVLLRNVMPVILFAIFTLFGPINILLSWPSMIRRLNQNVDDVASNKAPKLAVMVPLGVNMSIEWVAIILLAASSAILMVSIIASAGFEPAPNFRF